MSSLQPTLYNGDEEWFLRTYSGPAEQMDRCVMEGIVDRLAQAKVGIFSQCFYGGGSSYYETSVGNPFYQNYSLWNMSPDGNTFHCRPESDGTLPHRLISTYRRLVAEGNEPIKVFAEQCRRKGMKFLACLRMNDRHGCYTQNPCRFLREHPELTMQPWGGMDYRHAEVRDYIAAHIEELAANYNIDGIELDWMRWVKVFSEDVPVDQRLSVLDDFHRRIRTMLEEIGRNKGRKLLLSIRVPATLAECASHGYDVATYCRERLVDIICPSDFLFNDPYLAVADFKRLTRDTGILLMPSLHNSAGWSAGASSTENLRALAHSYYAQGADGISMFNWYTCYEINLPENYQAMEEAGALETLDRLPRAYLFNPIWGEDGEHNPRQSPTDRVFPYFARVARASPGKREIFPIFIAENTDKVKLKFRLKVEDLTGADNVAIDVNGQPLDLDLCATLFVGAGKRGDTRHFGPEWLSGAYTQFTFDNAGEILRNGGNEIGLTLITPNPVVDGDITLFEIWVEVEPR